jgi:hypothetical protein
MSWARELGIERRLLYTWKYQFGGGVQKKNHLNYSGKPAPETIEVRLRREVRELKKLWERKAAQIDFFASALRRVNQDQQASEAYSEPTPVVQTKLFRCYWGK